MAKLTIISSTFPAELSKVYFLDEAGALQKGLTSANLASGKYEVRDVPSLQDMADTLSGLRTNQVLTFGVPKHDSGLLVTKDKITPTSSPSTISRSNEHLQFAAEPAWLFIDHDPKPNAEFTPQELINLLENVAPNIFRAGAVVFPSASSHICRVDGQDITGSRGVHIYIPVRNGKDIPRAGDALQDIMWEAGLGFVEISKSGSLLMRSPLDASVAQSAKLDFAAGAICKDGLEQRRGDPIIVEPKTTDQHLDTIKYIKGPSSKAVTRANKEAARTAAEPDAKAAREKYAVDRALAEAQKLTGTQTPPPEVIEAARKRILEAANTEQLNPDFILYVEGADGIEPVAVKEIRNHFAEYDGKLCLDPIEPDYEGSKVVGKIYARGDVGFVNSFAHGGRRFYFGSDHTFIVQRSEDFMNIARELLQYCTGGKDIYSLLYYQQTYFQNYDHVFKPKADTDLKTMLMLRLEDARYKGAKMKLDTKFTANVRPAVQAACSVDNTSLETTNPPFWLTKQGEKGRRVLTVDHSRTDAQDYVLMQNGLFDLRQRKLLPFDKHYFTTSKLSFAYDPAATCPMFEKYIEETFSGDKETIWEVRKMLGYLMTSYTHLQKVFGCIGPTRGGKGVFQGVVNAMVGPENIFSTNLDEVAKDTFNMQGSINKKIMLLSDARETSESVKGGGLAEKLLKISGQDRLSIRRMRKDHWEGYPTARVVIYSNIAPRINDGSGAMFRRFVLIPFDNCVLHNEDRNLDKKLATEYAGIFNWALEGVEAIMNGEEIVTPPAGEALAQEVKDASSSGIAFADAKCFFESEAVCDKKDLYNAYRDMCLEEGNHPKSNIGFMREFRPYTKSQGHKITEHKKEKPNGEWSHWFKGVGLRSQLGMGEVITASGLKFKILSQPHETVRIGKVQFAEAGDA